MNVSSIVVKTKSEYLEEVMNNINAVDFCEVHFFNPEGTIVATIEGKSIDEQMERMKKIQSMAHVYNANLSYSYCEEELAPALKRINAAKPTLQ